MTAFIPLSIIGVVVAFLVGVLGDIPMVGASTTPVDDSYSPEAADEMSSMFTAAYTIVVNELVSYQADPDQQRAEARYQEMRAYTGSVAPRFQDLSNSIRNDFTTLTRPIIFSSDRDGNREIYVMLSDGTVQTRLTSNPAHDTDAVLSADGTKIAFSSDRDGDAEIYVMSVDGGNVTRLTASTGPDWAPQWSPDGTKLTFLSERDGNRQVYVMGTDGAAPTKLTSMGAYQLGNWSPDGLQVVFSSSGLTIDPDAAGIYVMTADGTGITQLTADGDGAPRWSPDGTRIVFHRCTPCDVWVMDANGANPANLTNAVEDDQDPVWSPDGTQIAYLAGQDANREVYVMNADSTAQTNLTNNSVADLITDWGAYVQ